MDFYIARKHPQSKQDQSLSRVYIKIEFIFQLLHNRFALSSILLTTTLLTAFSLLMTEEIQAATFQHSNYPEALAHCEALADPVWWGPEITCTYHTTTNPLYSFFTMEYPGSFTYNTFDIHCPASASQCTESAVELDYKQPYQLCVGNPINIATGNKFQTESDYQSNKPYGLSFVRYYNSSSYAIDRDIGKKWRHGFNRAIKIVDTQAQVARSNGQTFLFNHDGNNWIGDVDIPDTLVEELDGNSVRTGWVYTDSNDTVETYNAQGQLLTITNRAGQSQTLSYNLTTAEGGDDNADTLDKVTGFGGETLLFAYDNNQRISTMTDPEGNEYTYAYDAAGNLSSVTYPDSTPLDDTDNPVRAYHYENTTYPHHLTGLTDETGSRVIWGFDSEGRAISSELDGGVDKSTLDFSVADQVKVTNPLGKDTTYHFTTLHGVKKVTQVEGHATASCAGANQNYSYDANGYLTSKTDWEGNITTYTHDARGLETSRTEASGTPQERVITTEWHTDFRLPTKITEPGQVTDFVYDSQGRLTSQTTHAIQP